MLKKTLNFIFKYFSNAIIFVFILTTMKLSSYAQVLPQHFTGKISVIDKGVVKEGSGVIFVYKKDVFVLSAEHVALSSKKQSQLLFLNTKFNINLVSSDWISGLSLFKLPLGVDKLSKKLNLHKKSFLGLQQFNGPKLINSFAKFNFHISGFLHGSKKNIVLQSRSILKLNHKDQVFLSGQAMLEIFAPAQKGMSGGGTFYKNPKTNKWNFAGLNSNIYTDEDNKTHLLLISALNAKLWIKNTLQNQTIVSSVLEKDGFKSVTINGLAFASGSALPLVSQAVWGTDPIGIGGLLDSANTKPQNSQPISVNLSLENYSEVFDKRLPADIINLFRSLKTKQLSQSRIVISYFLYNNQIYLIRSLNQFFKYLNLGYKPVIELSSAFDNIFFTNKKEKRREIAQKITRLTETLSLDDLKLNVPADAQFFSDLQAITSKINSEEWFLVGKAELQNILESPSWSILYNDEAQFDKVVELTAQLYSYQSVLSYLIF